VRLRQLISLALIVLFAALLCGCADNTLSPPIETNSLPSSDSPPDITLPPADVGSSVDTKYSVRIVVTANFGEQVLSQKTVTIKEGTNALDALQQVAQVKTKYGGGFVSSIGGISSEYGGTNRQRKDWFLYMNGISVNTGAGSYLLSPGDIEHWDYRDWSFRQFIPAIIGDFPEPFLHGYGGEVYPTVVTYQDGWEEEARLIADRLEELGVENIACRGLEELAEADKESSNLILLGTSEFEPIKELNEPWNRLGFYCQSQEGSLKVFNPTGDLIAEYDDNAGLIQATQSVWNPKGVGACENVVWMVSGLDEAGVRAAVDTLVNNYNEFKYAYAVVIAGGGEILKVPQ